MIAREAQSTTLLPDDNVELQAYHGFRSRGQSRATTQIETGMGQMRTRVHAQIIPAPHPREPDSRSPRITRDGRGRSSGSWAGDFR
jgi:hypothetical protein